jgi:alanine-glyoxylate transaminase/serine-glyoxylate transaminase/serine-pyruvate transaminase
MVGSYWGSERTYHHTAPISMNYALREGLAIILEEGLEARWKRHELHHQALVSGVEALGLAMHVNSDFRLWSLNAVQIPQGIDDLQVRRQLLENYDLEIGGGLGELQGKIWRIGLMGENSRPQPVLYLLYALEKCLSAQGFACPPGAGVQAASAVLNSSPG